MTNIEIKKAITQAIKYISNYKIDMEIWQDENEQYFYQITVSNLDNDENNNIMFSENSTKENIIKEAKKVKTYLQKHFENVNITEIEI